MRKVSILTLLITFMTLSFISCEENEVLKAVSAGFVNCHTDSEGYVSVLTDDMGNRYMVTNKGEQLLPDTTYRMVCAYTFRDSGSITIDKMIPTYCGRIAGVLNYNAMEERDFPYLKEMKDPVNIELAYPGSGYLNIRIGVKVGDKQSSHEFQVVHNDDSERVSFTIYHNAHTDAEGYTLNAYLSVPLSDFGLSKGDSIFLSSKGYDKDYNLVMAY